MLSLVSSILAQEQPNAKHTSTLISTDQPDVEGFGGPHPVCLANVSLPTHCPNLDDALPPLVLRPSHLMLRPLQGCGLLYFVVVVYLAVVATVSVTADPQPPSAYDLLDRLRQHYGNSLDYQDRGDIEYCRGDTCRQYAFETARDSQGTFIWRLRDAGQEEHQRVVWSDGEATFVYDRVLDQRKQVDSPLVELALGLGEVGYDALVVPALLAGGSTTLEDPEGAAVDGPEPCPVGGGSCWVLSLARMAGAMESYWWVDTESLTIRRVESIFSPFDVGGRPEPTTRLVIDHRQLTSPTTIDLSSLEVPSAGRLVERFESPAESTASGEERVARQESEGVFDPSSLGFVDEISVDILSVQVRILDSFGEPLRDLEPADLVARVGRREIPITHVDWVSPGSPEWGSAEPAVPSPPSSDAETPLKGDLANGKVSVGDPAIWDEMFEAAENPRAKLNPRIIVIFVQADFEPTRIRGHLRLIPLVKELIGTLEPEDRLALLTFDSHLKMWHDLTTDHQAVAESLYDAVRPGGAPVLRNPRGPGPFMRPRFDPAAARKVAWAERALGMTAEALIPLSGRKEIIFLGWGMGEYRGGSVLMTSDYYRALEALDKAQATVSVLDVTEADWHTLEFGLKSVAASTGGTYQRTFHFASQATRRLARQLKGYYMVYLDRGAIPEAHGALHIGLRKGPGEALHAPIKLAKQR